MPLADDERAADANGAQRGQDGRRIGQHLGGDLVVGGGVPEARAARHAREPVATAGGRPAVEEPLRPAPEETEERRAPPDGAVEPQVHADDR